MVVCGPGLVLSALVDLLEDGGDTAALGLLGLLVTFVGAAIRRAVAMPARVPPRVALRSVAVAGAAMVAVSTIAYLATGTVDDIGDALFESTAGFTTTALTVLEDLESVDRGVLFWRALTQWLGGFFALATIVAVLPFLGVGSPRPREASAALDAKHLFSAHVRHVLRRYFLLYLGLTGIGAVLFLTGGMGPFDAVTYALTTISTGGFGNHDGSFGHFDSDVLEWLGVAGMLLGGLSLPLLWRAVRGREVSALRSTELNAYLVLVVGATAVLAVAVDDAAGLEDRVRTAAFTATSMVSTTGHWVTDWTVWPFGPQLLLLVLMGVGAMSGSMGGGFRVVRALALLSYVWRELARQLRARSVQVVRVGTTVIDEDTVDRMVGYQVLFIGTAAGGLLGLALTGEDLVTSLSGAVSTLCTVGPALGDLAPGTTLVGASIETLAVLMILMTAGRLELYPALNFAVSVITWPYRAATGRRHRPGQDRR